ncbi:MAG TPA: PIN domain-containing protein [archaeon]|nr:PIN domain-containing protein [archaeon]
MTGSFVFDTNIIVYAYDNSEKPKQKFCLPLVEKVFSGEITGIVSNQVLAEIFHVLSRKVENPDPENAMNIVKGIQESENWTKINYNSGTVIKAASTANSLKMMLWDCLIAETMLENNFNSIYTENLKDFNKIQKINAICPF